VQNEPNGYLYVTETFGAAKPTGGSIQKSKQPKRNPVAKSHLDIIGGDIAVGHIFDLIEALVFAANLKQVSILQIEITPKCREDALRAPVCIVLHLYLNFLCNAMHYATMCRTDYIHFCFFSHR